MSEVKVMGIVNLTGDSFYAPSRCLDKGLRPDVAQVVERVGRMRAEGADIIDLGACSTRPDSQPVGAEEEWRRLAPVLEALWTKFPDLTVSVDTYWASVIERAFGLACSVLGGNSGVGSGSEVDSVCERVRGQLIVNDISAGEDDPEMLPLVGKLGLRYIAMHKRGTPATMQGMCEYEDVVEDVMDYFRGFAAKAAGFGISDWILDPGFGFAKTLEQNYLLMKNLHRFSELGRPVLAGVSRKSMVYRLHGITPEESLPQTSVLNYAAIEGGAEYLRVHDVAEAARTVRAFSMLH